MMSLQMINPHCDRVAPVLTPQLMPMQDLAFGLPEKKDIGETITACEDALAEALHVAPKWGRDAESCAICGDTCYLMAYRRPNRTMSHIWTPHSCDDQPNEPLGLFYEQGESRSSTTSRVSWDRASEAQETSLHLAKSYESRTRYRNSMDDAIHETGRSCYASPSAQSHGPNTNMWPRQDIQGLRASSPHVMQHHHSQKTWMPTRNVPFTPSSLTHQKRQSPTTANEIRRSLMLGPHTAAYASASYAPSFCNIPSHWRCPCWLWVWLRMKRLWICDGKRDASAPTLKPPYVWMENWKTGWAPLNSEEVIVTKLHMSPLAEICDPFIVLLLATTLDAPTTPKDETPCFAFLPVRERQQQKEAGCSPGEDRDLWDQAAKIMAMTQDMDARWGVFLKNIDTDGTSTIEAPSLGVKNFDATVASRLSYPS